jgi:ketosteroid isomerase-like protein
MTSAEEVFQHHLSAFAEGDIDEILKDYTEDTIVIYDDRIARGLAEIRKFFSHWIEELLPPGCRFDLDRMLVVDDLVFITWTAESEHLLFELGTDTFLIRDGKVLRQTVAAKIRNKDVVPTE